MLSQLGILFQAICGLVLRIKFYVRCNMKNVNSVYLRCEDHLEVLALGNRYVILACI